jgi:hypothetical protein
MAKRDLTAALAAQFRAKGLKLVALVEIEFVSETMRMWSGYGTLSWNSQSWLGMGSMGSISSITESSDIAANGVTLSLSGIDAKLLDESLNEIRPNKRAKVWFGAMDTVGKVVVDPYLAFQGFCDVPTVQDEGETCTISLTCEPRWLDRRARIWRYTAQDQALLSPGDTGFRFLKDLDKQTYWGKATPMFTTGSSGGGCFAGAVPIFVPHGFHPIGELPRDREFTIVNHTGRHQARLIVHERWSGFVRSLGASVSDGYLVTVDHPMGVDGSVTADVKYSMCPRLWYSGPVFTLEVVTDRDEDRHFLIFNGDVAHNKIPIGDEGGHDTF